MNAKPPAAPPHSLLSTSSLLPPPPCARPPRPAPIRSKRSPLPLPQKQQTKRLSLPGALSPPHPTHPPLLENLPPPRSHPCPPFCDRRRPAALVGRPPLVRRRPLARPRAPIPRPRLSPLSSLPPLFVCTPLLALTCILHTLYLQSVGRRRAFSRGGARRWRPLCAPTPFPPHRQGSFLATLNPPPPAHPRFVAAFMPFFWFLAPHLLCSPSLVILTVAW